MNQADVKRNKSDKEFLKYSQEIKRKKLSQAILLRPKVVNMRHVFMYGMSYYNNYYLTNQRSSGSS